MKSFASAEAEFAWFIGFWEGEGSCNVHRKVGRNGKTYWYLQITACQNESEPLEKVRHIIGSGSINGPHGSNGKQYRWVITGDTAWELAERMLPYLSTRRQVQLNEKMEAVAAGQQATSHVNRRR